MSLNDLVTRAANDGLEVVGLTDAEPTFVTIWLNRPETRNAQTPTMWRLLAEVGASLPASVRVVLLRGRGPVFSSGIDLRAFTPEGLDGETILADIAASDDAAASELIAGFQAGFTWLHDRNDVLTVAVVQGAAVGAGFQLALACDLRVATNDARFAMRETSLGLVPDLTGTYPLVRAVGYSRALELCVTGRWVGAAEAVSVGLANVAVDAEDLDATVGDLVSALTSAPASAVRQTKAVLKGAIDSAPDAQRRFERETQVGLLRGLMAALQTQ